MMAVKLPCEPKLAKAQVDQEPLLIIDWDDTLLPSSFIQNKQLVQVRENKRKNLIASRPLKAKLHL
jgi:hypothetical protein